MMKVTRVLYIQKTHKRAKKKKSLETIELAETALPFAMDAFMFLIYFAFSTSN